MPTASDCRRMYSSSPARSAGFAVTRTRPAIAAPYCRMAHSGSLGAQTTIRAPGVNRPSSQCAARRASSRSSAYVHVRGCACGARAISARRSPQSRAAWTSTSPVVRSKIFSSVLAGTAEVVRDMSVLLHKFGLVRYLTSAVRDPAPGIAPLHGRVETVGRGEFLEPAPFRRVACDAVEQSGQDLRSLQPHVVVGLVDHEFLHHQLVDRHTGHAVGQ